MNGESDGLPFWRKELFLPGAKQVCNVAKELGKLPFWTLNGDRKILTNHPSGKPQGLITAARSDKGGLVVAYSPQGEPIRFAAGTSPARGTITWFNPRTGESTTESGPIGTELTPPSKGDWVLIVKPSP